jgi:hypothetical protein
MKSFRSIGPCTYLLALLSLFAITPGSFAQTAGNTIPVVTIAATDPLASESGDTGTFTLFRAGPTNSTLNVFCAIGGAASNGVDYALLPNVVTIPAGATSAQISVVPVDDALAEGDETVTLHLAPPPYLTPINYIIGRPDTATVILKDNDGPVTNRPPKVSLISPTEGQTFAAPADILLLANASDPGGFLTLSTVEFFAGTQSLGIVTNNPFSASPVGPFHLAWTNVPAGGYVLTALATDNGGLTGTSAPVNIVVKTLPPPTNNPPVVTIVAPTNGASFIAPADITITADVSDVGDFVRFVSFYEGTNRLALFLLDPLVGANTGLVIPVGYRWNNVGAGSYSLTVVGTTTRGLSTTSAPVNITVRGSSNTPPTVTIVATDPVAVEGTNYHGFVGPSTIFTNFCSGTNTATFLVRRTGDTNGDLTVSYAIGGTASNGVDYATIPGDVTIPAGKRFALITIVPLEDVDAVARPYETVVLGLTPPPPPAANAVVPYIVGWPGKAAAVILEEHNLPVVPVSGSLPDHSFHASWPGTNGFNFCLQISTNMVDWVPVCTNTVVKGSIEFVDPEAGNFSSRYYRAVPVAGPPGY